MSDNPYHSPTNGNSPPPRPALLLWSVGAVFATSLVGGILGCGIGAALGAFLPSYYRSVFSGGDRPAFDPVAVGIGQGLTQGVVFGGAVGLGLVAMFYWYAVRPEKAARR